MGEPGMAGIVPGTERIGRLFMGPARQRHEFVERTMSPACYVYATWVIARSPLPREFGMSWPKCLMLSGIGDHRWRAKP